MKTLENIMVAAVAVLSCIGFSACEKQKDNKLLKQIDADVYVNNMSAQKVTFTFSYDGKGNVVSLMFCDDRGEIVPESSQFVWSGNTMKVVEDGEETLLYTVADGRIRTGSSDGEEIVWYGYNSSKQLVDYVVDGMKIKLDWNGDKLTHLHYSKNDDASDPGADMNLGYGNMKCEGYVPVLLFLMFGEFDMESIFSLAQPEIVGMTLKQLPVSIETEDMSLQCSYQLDKEGYIESMKLDLPDIGLGSMYMNISMKWE